MARDDLHFRLRIPDELKARIEAAATEKRRSMTAEIVARLEESFADSSGAWWKDEKTRELYVKYLNAIDAQNNALKRSQRSLELLLYNFAYAVKKAAEGDTEAFDSLVEQERQRSFFDRISFQPVDLEDD